MPSLEEIREQSRWRDILEGQPQYLAITLLMTLGAMSLLTAPTDAPRLLFLTAHQWALVSIALAIVHQLIVAIVFRLQLHRNLMNRLFGPRDMTIWARIFIPLLVARPITLVLIAAADTTPITTARAPEIILGALLVVLAVWVLHSVLVHFTIPRALGGDHFRQRYAQMPLVRKGAFKYTDNAMYGLAFAGLWGIALLFGSRNALIVALFQHAYIWLHMYCTEGPDMAWIYGKRA